MVGQNGFVLIAFAQKNSCGLVGLNIGPGASLLMIAFVVIASCTCMPAEHIVSTRVTVVLIVVPFVGFGWIVAMIVCWGKRDAWHQNEGIVSWCCIVVIVVSSSTATVQVSTSYLKTISAAIIVGCIIIWCLYGCWDRHWGCCCGWYHDK